MCPIPLERLQLICLCDAENETTQAYNFYVFYYTYKYANVDHVFPSLLLLTQKVISCVQHSPQLETNYERNST